MFKKWGGKGKSSKGGKSPDALMQQYKDNPYILNNVLPEWSLADKNNSGKLDKAEIKSLLRKLNVRLKDNEFEAKFKGVDDNNSGDLDFEEFKKFLENLRERLELKPLFDKYSKSKYMSKELLATFLKKEQNENISLEVAAGIIASSHRQKDNMDFLAFCDYIFAPGNSLYNTGHTSKVYQDMTQPLPYYFINSSHNTYLLGNQLQGEASTEAYKSSLVRGCRCVEVDCWDGDDGDPVVTHGHTMVNKIKFRDIMVTVKQHGFAVSEYPVILSLENHCSTAQQVKMASILKEVFGDMLPPPFDDPKKLPSPEDLKNKILIKGKKIKGSGAALSSSQELSANEDDDEEEEEEDDEKDTTTITQSSSSSGASGKKELGADKKKKHASHATAIELSNITHFASTRFAGFQKDKDLFPWDMSSNSELKVKKFFKNDRDQLITHNIQFLSRTYPKGTRFDSSNYSPFESWAMGCQITALNYQTGDVPMFINTGKFFDNGNSGYLLKPPTLLPNGLSIVLPKVKITLQVISGFQLPKVSGTMKGDVIDPYVDIKVLGNEADYAHVKTKVVSNNGYNPIWNETFEFTIERSDLAIFLIQVYDEDKLSKNDFVAYSAVPVTSLRTGYRSVQLYSSKFEDFPDSSLLIKVSAEEVSLQKKR